MLDIISKIAPNYTSCAQSIKVLQLGPTMDTSLLDCGIDTICLVNIYILLYFYHC